MKKHIQRYFMLNNFRQKIRYLRLMMIESQDLVHQKIIEI
jgi:hypothetical protein